MKAAIFLTNYLVFKAINFKITRLMIAQKILTFRQILGYPCAKEILRP